MIPKKSCASSPPRQSSSAGAVFPVPPFEQFWIVVPVGRVVDRTAEDVEHATVHRLLLHNTEPLVKLLRVPLIQLLNLAKPHLPQVFGDAFSHPWDLLQLQRGQAGDDLL